MLYSGANLLNLEAASGREPWASFQMDSLLLTIKTIATANITTESPSKNPMTRFADDPRIPKSSITEDMLEVKRPTTRRSIPFLNFLSSMEGIP